MEASSMNNSVDGSVRTRACEACRAAKIRCKSSPQPGVCQKCLNSKKECIFKTGPRTRRSRRAVTECPASSNTSPVPDSSSKTFSIDFALAAQPELEDSFDVLRAMHERHIQDILPPVEEDIEVGHGIEFPDKLPSPVATPASSTREYSITDLDGKPQFSLASAESLLKHFRSMLSYLPCIDIPKDTTVQSLAATKPFLLLGVLTSASASKSLQGHSLYDTEFRKVLGLKFVAAGERTLELLQGLLVYCAWYPFHIRPQSKQMFRYLRMVGDLVHDLGLDDDTEYELLPQGSDEQLERVRSYLGYSYLEAVFSSSWRPFSRTSTRNSEWILQCCDSLERVSRGSSDIALSVLVREGIVQAQGASAVFDRGQQTEDQRRLLLLGLQTRSHELVQQIPVEIALSAPVRLTTLFLEFYLNSASLLRRHDERRNSAKDETLKPDAVRLANAVAPTRRFLDYVLGLDQDTFSGLTAIDWGRIIIAIIIAVRLSLPIRDCLDFDSTWARAEIGLHSFLDRLCSMTISPAKVDTLSATRVILQVVQRNFDQRVQAAEKEEDAAIRGLTNFGCPFLDGSLDQYLPQWDPDMSTSQVITQNVTQVETEHAIDPLPAGSQRQAVFHDMWATMTMGWANLDT